MAWCYVAMWSRDVGNVTLGLPVGAAAAAAAAFKLTDQPAIVLLTSHIMSLL